MKPPVTVFTLVAAVAVGTGLGLVFAQQKQEYVPPKAEKMTLAEKALHGVPGKQVTIVKFKFPPNWVGGKHTHSGPVFVYVVDGTLTIEEAGQPQKSFGPGELYVEPIGQIMRGLNLSAKEPTEVVVFQVHGKGEALMHKAK